MYAIFRKANSHLLVHRYSQISAELRKRLAILSDVEKHDKDYQEQETRKETGETGERKMCNCR